MRLTLDDGTELTGAAAGAFVPVAGEVVFNTGMAGAPEGPTLPPLATSGKLLPEIPTHFLLSYTAFFF